MGDMSFFGPHDVAEAVRGIQESISNRMINMTDSTGDAQFRSGLQEVIGANLPAASMNSVPEENFKIAHGSHSMVLQIKSAITGANVHVTLYKCKARYSIPKMAKWEENRGTSTYNDLIFPALSGGNVTANLIVTGKHEH